MDLGLPVRGLDPLAPLVAWIVVYLILLVALRLLLWPLLDGIRRRGTLARLVRRLVGLVILAALVGGLLLAFLSALSYLLWGTSLLSWLESPPVVVWTLPLWLTIPILLLLLALIVVVVLRPALARIRS